MMKQHRLFKPNVEKLKKRGDIENLIRALNYDDKEVRRKAEEALVEIGKPAVSSLIWAREMGNLDPRILIILMKIGEPAIEALVQTLKNRGTWYSERQVIEDIVMIGEPAIKPLIQTLKDENKNVRRRAAEVLDKLGWKSRNDTEKAYYLIAVQKLGDLRNMGEPAVEHLIQALKDKDNEVRGKAAEVLGRIGDSRAVEPLIRILKDENEDVRKRAAEALVKIGEPAVEHLIQALKDKDNEVRGKAAEVLGRIGDSRAVEPLIQVLDNESTRYAAVIALGRIGDSRAVEPLIQALGDESEHIRSTVAGVLGRIGDSRAVEPLIWTLIDENSNVRRSVAKALMKIGELAVEPLIQILKDDFWRVHYSEGLENAVEALLGIGDTRATEIIIDYLENHNAIRPSLKKWKLFGSYKRLISRIFFSTYGKYIEEFDSYLNDSNLAVQELCAINTPISNNILHKIAKRQDIRVLIDFDWEDREAIVHIISFNYQRKQAKTELNRRVNPPYDPFAYLDKESWQSH